MKMFYNGTSIKSLNIKHFEVSTNDCTAIPSDLQSGVTCVSKGKKITGTGKSFEFANYGHIETNTSRYIPANINFIEVASIEYPIKSNIDLNLVKDVDFSNGQLIGKVIIDNNEYDLVVTVQSNVMRITCDETIRLQIFYGKDNYV